MHKETRYSDRDKTQTGTGPSDYGFINQRTKMQNSKQPPAGFPGGLSQGARGPANRHGFTRNSKQKNAPPAHVLRGK